MNIHQSIEVSASEQKIFSFLSNYLNIKAILPEQVEDFMADLNGFSFRVSGMPMVEFRAKEVQPNKKLSFFSGKDDLNFTLIFEIDGLDELSSKVDVRLEAKMNAFARMIAEKPLKKTIEEIAKKLKEKFD